MISKPHVMDHLEEIFRAGLARVSPYRMIMNHVRLSDSLLMVDLEDQKLTVDLQEFHRILVIGAGKATAPMARALEEILGERIDDGTIVVKYGHTEPLHRIRTLQAGHPVPDQQGVAGARAIADLARSADARTLVIGLLSGGGSALLPLPLESGTEAGPVAVSLVEKQETTRVLLACGADIEEINCVRKHLSGIKGGRLLQQLAPARSLNFILSDVVGDDLSSIASGLTVSDPTTFADALAILERYRVTAEVPANVLEVLQLGSRGLLPETLKPGAEAETLATNVLIGTNRTALHAAGEKAAELGYRVVQLTASVTGEARQVAKFLAGIGKDVKGWDMLAERPACILSGGEPVVTLQGSGKGGRNQEMALAFLAEVQRQPEAFEGVYFLAASTDGNDGPTDAAGAFACAELAARAGALEVSLADFLQNNDAYHCFEKLDGLFKTGPTNTNVCDLHILLIP